ncbi:hypothetical protein LCGC14_1379980 [marine sediment metagenome]|uniref:Uncharacterized protein n=1 Tax=marine sediment metagenome TaxID=412755 RepID=A0A0F9N4N0_9ZZZZ
MTVYLIRRNQTGQIEVSVVRSGQIETLHPVIGSFDLGEPNVGVKELAAILMSHHINDELSKAKYITNDYLALPFLGGFIWRFLIEPTNLLTVTDDQINSLMEDLR